MKGFVQFINAERGFCFAWDLEKKIKYFIHVSNINAEGGIKSLHVGTLIEFTPGLTARGPVGLKVRLLDRAETVATLLDAGSKTNGGTK